LRLGSENIRVERLRKVTVKVATKNHLGIASNFTL
jgi:hypothetical protein